MGGVFEHGQNSMVGGGGCITRGNTQHGNGTRCINISASLRHTPFRGRTRESCRELLHVVCESEESALLLIRDTIRFDSKQ